MAEKEEMSQDENVMAASSQAIRSFGFWRSTKNISYWALLVSRTCFFTTLITQTIAMFMARGDSEKLFECFSVLSFCAMGAFKLKSIYSNQRNWVQLLERLDALEKKQMNASPSSEEYDSDGESNDTCFKGHIHFYTQRFRSLSVLLHRIYFFTLSFFILSPFIEYAYWKLTGADEVNFPHVLLGWSPLEGISFWGYLATVVIELVSATYTVMVHFAFDLMVFGLMIVLSGQFVLLRDFSESIGGKGRGYDLTQRRDARAYDRIKRCHQILITLENATMELNDLVRDILGVYYMMAVFCLCSVAVRLSTEEMSMMKVVTLTQYTSSCLTQLFLFCYYGDMVMHEVSTRAPTLAQVYATLSVNSVSSVSSGQGAYAAAWWRLAPRVRRHVLLLAAWQARGRSLRAGPFNSLDLPSFILIVRAAYSYYAVLRK